MSSSTCSSVQVRSLSAGMDIICSAAEGERNSALPTIAGVASGSVTQQAPRSSNRGASRRHLLTNHCLEAPNDGGAQPHEEVCIPGSASSMTRPSSSTSQVYPLVHRGSLNHSSRGVARRIVVVRHDAAATGHEWLLE